MSSSVPKSEYPRPDLDRSDRWLSLNGTWGFESEDGACEILVPFAWETAASGVQRTWLEHASYRRTISVPDDWSGARVFLCFGAVHHRATVAIDGEVVGTHEGGYTSFEFDVTSFAAAGDVAELTVEVEAPADKRFIPHGKQRSIPRDDYDGVSFTPSSGIWQSVWLEARGLTYASTVSLRGDSLTGFDVEVQLDGTSPGDATVMLEVLDAGGERLELVTDASGAASGVLRISAPRLWSPSDPQLYSIAVRVADEDTVIATSGLRRFEARGEHLFLNDERFYMRGVLDQGYWPTTGITAPDDEALVLDLELARGAGFNLVRKHLKFEEPRWLHWADRMGMLVWAEPASTSRFSAEGAAIFEAQIPEMVARDANHPSIVIWGLYNEEWGLDWDIPGDAARSAAAVRAYDTLAKLDSTRPIVENSGWAHVKTDLADWHYYDEKPASWARNVAEIAAGTRTAFPVPLGPAFIVNKDIYGSEHVPRTGIPLVNSEYGGGFTSLERAWHVRWQTQEMRRHDRIAGYVYTELADVEHESAGLFDTGRARKDWGGLDPADVNAQAVLILDILPLQAGTDIPLPSSPLAVGLRLSHHGRTSLAGTVCAAWVPAGQPFGPTQDRVVASAAIAAQPFEVSGSVHLRIPAPQLGSSARLHVWLVDENDRVRARTFLDAGPIEA